MSIDRCLYTPLRSNYLGLFTFCRNDGQAQLWLFLQQEGQEFCRDRYEHQSQNFRKCREKVLWSAIWLGQIWKVPCKTFRCNDSPKVKSEYQYLSLLEYCQCKYAAELVWEEYQSQVHTSLKSKVSTIQGSPYHWVYSKSFIQDFWNFF